MPQPNANKPEDTGHPRLKMYLLVKDTIATGFAINSVAHASLACYLVFKNDPETIEWLNTKHFRKVTCKVTSQEFEAAKQHPDYIVMTESALGDQEVVLAFRPRRHWPTAFKSYKLYK